MGGLAHSGQGCSGLVPLALVMCLQASLEAESSMLSKLCPCRILLCHLDLGSRTWMLLGWTHRTLPFLQVTHWHRHLENGRFPGLRWGWLSPAEPELSYANCFKYCCKICLCPFTCSFKKILGARCVLGMLMGTHSSSQ